MPAKKAIKKTVAKKAPVKKIDVKPTPVMEHKCECGENCKCHCHGSAHWIKHIIVWAIIFALGMVCGKMTTCGHHKMPKQIQRMQPVFVNGCLDIKSIANKKLIAKLETADVNSDECISVEEYKAVKESMKPMGKMNRGSRGPKTAK